MSSYTGKMGSADVKFLRMLRADDNVEKMEKEIHEDMYALISDLVDEGKNVTQGNVGAIPRVDTGYMMNAVDARIDKSDDDSVSGSFGWDNETFSNPAEPGVKYYVYQERGTSLIEPMNALEDAGEEIFKKFAAGTDVVMRRNGLVD